MRASRAVPMVEAMGCLILADALLRQSAVNTKNFSVV